MPTVLPLETLLRCDGVGEPRAMLLSTLCPSKNRLSFDDPLFLLSKAGEFILNGLIGEKGICGNGLCSKLFMEETDSLMSISSSFPVMIVRIGTLSSLLIVSSLEAMPIKII